MAGPLKCVFLGGPCNGQTKYVPADIVQSGSVACGGSVYYANLASANPVFLNWAPHIEQQNQADIAYDPRAVLLTFNLLMRTLAIGVPAEVRRIRGSIARMRKAVR